MRLICSLAVCCVLLASVASASYEPSYPDDQSKFECLDSGTGLIGAPYMEDFQWMLIIDQHFAYFVFSYTLDPGQSQEVEAHQRVFHLSWDTCSFPVLDRIWTGVSMPLRGDPKETARLFLRHLRQLSFINNIENRR